MHEILIQVYFYTDVKAVLNYIAKYASKSEIKSDSYKNILAKVTTHYSATRPFLSAVVRIINIFITERDWSVQKIIYYFLGLNLIHSSRETAILDIRPNKDQSIILAVEEGTLIKKGLSWLKKYLKRTKYEHSSGVRSEDVTLFEFIQN